MPSKAQRCPKCKAATRVLRTRSDDVGRAVRYRECECGYRFTTREIPVGETATATFGTLARTALIQFAETFGIDPSDIFDTATDPENPIKEQHNADNTPDA